MKVINSREDKKLRSNAVFQSNLRNLLESLDIVYN